ncbi:MAG: serine hydrolase domain-containing protein [Woeseiaceae bacterium]|tara:strand:+ start:2909 stop:4222 length:1314 start_codon:yes stop_codon:yes gene_type:complete
MGLNKKIFTVLLSIILWLPLNSYSQIKDSSFVSPSGVKEIKEQLKKLPKKNIWWTINGIDMAWNNKNLHQILTTVNVYRSGPVSVLDYNLANNINTTEVNTPVGLMNFQTFIDHDKSTVMGVVIAHKGKIIFEHYPRMEEHEKPIYWSVSKVLPATLLRIYEERKQLDVSKPIDFYLKELKDTSYAGIRIRNILDMASGLDCSDNYETFESCYYLYSMSIGDGFRTEDAEDTPYDFVKNTKIERNAPQGEIFSYSGVDTFVLAWLVEELSGMPYQDALSKEIWNKIGAESDASFIAPRYGIPISHGGFLANMRDMIRFGLLFTPSYKTVSEEKIISDDHIDLILTKGNPKLMQNLYQKIPSANMPDDLRHNIYQWDAVYENGDFFKGGWAGQGLLINPTRDIVAVWTGYKRDSEHDAREMRMIVREVLNTVYGETPE